MPEHGAVLDDDSAHTARALARLAQTFDPRAFPARCNHGNFARGLAEIGGQGGWHVGYEQVNPPKPTGLYKTFFGDDPEDRAQDGDVWVPRA